MQNYTLNNLVLDTRDGSVNWAHIDSAVTVISSYHFVSDDVCALIKGRLASGVLTVSLNTLTLLHTLVLNGGQVLGDAVAASKLMKYVERALSKPTIPGLDLATAQLLLDWAFICGHTDLGQKSYSLLNTSRHQRLASLLRPSYVAVLIKHDRQAGVVPLGPMQRGLDFGRVFADPMSGPAMGSVSPTLAALASRLLNKGLSAQPDPSTYRTDPGRDWLWQGRTGAATPGAAADAVLRQRSSLLTEAAELVAAQQQVLEVARQQGRASTAAIKKLTPRMDVAYTAASNCVQVRDQIQALLQEPLSEAQTSQLLQLVDEVNKALEGWQRAAAGTLYDVLGIRVQPMRQASPQRQQQQQGGPPSSTSAVSAAPAGSCSPDRQRGAPLARTGPCPQQAPVQQPLPAAAVARTPGGPTAVPLPGTVPRAGSGQPAVDLLTGDNNISNSGSMHMSTHSTSPGAAYEWPAVAVAPPAPSGLPAVGANNPFAAPAVAATSSMPGATHNHAVYHSPLQQAAARAPSTSVGQEVYDRSGSTAASAMASDASARVDDSSGDEGGPPLVNPLAQLPAATLAHLSSGGASHSAVAAPSQPAVAAAPTADYTVASLSAMQLGPAAAAVPPDRPVAAGSSSSSDRLLEKAHHMYQAVQERCASSGHVCSQCRAPTAHQLVPAMHHLLLQQQQQHEHQLRALAEQHQKEIAELKAMAVRKLKEVMLQQAIPQ